MPSSPSITTVTLNAAVDLSLRLARFDEGAVLKASDESLDTSGKGWNVTRALARMEERSTAIVVVGNDFSGRFTADADADSGIALVPIASPHPTRVNVTLLGNEATTHIRAPGSNAEPAVLDEVATAVEARTASNGYVVVSGSVPENLRDQDVRSFYGRLIGPDQTVCVDTSGRALRLAVEAGVNIVKPNRAELEELVGSPLDSIDAVVAAAGEVQREGVGSVLVSLGSEGAILCDEEGVLRVRATPSRPLYSDVGAGDAFVAGYVRSLAHGATRVDALAWAAACGTASVATRTPADLDIAYAQRLMERVTLTPPRHAT